MTTYCQDAREQVKLTQVELASLVGVNRATIAAIEGGRKPKEPTAEKIAEILIREGCSNVVSSTLHLGRILSSPEISASYWRIGQLLSCLPLDDPRSKFWEVLGEGIGRSANYMQGTLHALHSQLYASDNPAPWISDRLRPILLDLPATADTAHALRGGGYFATDDIALLWLQSLTAAAWSLWLYTSPGELPH